MTPLPASFHAETRDRLRTRAEAAGLGGLLILQPGNLTYATGWSFSVNERPMGLWLPVDGEAVLLVPLLELENAAEATGLPVETYPEFPGETSPELWMLGRATGLRVAVDRLDARLLGAARALVAGLDLSDHVLPERAVKRPEEIALAVAAAGYADMVLARLHAVAAGMIQAGAGERDLMADATDHARAALARDLGSASAGTRCGITASVHSGPRAALPHGATGARVPRPGETLIAGIGAHLGNYHAESGATFVLGEPTADQRRVMAAMAAAAEATAEALADRAPCAEVNERALAPLRAAGLGDALRHRIGHGMGVEGQEAPWLAPGDPTPAAPGMVFSCEPGVYRPGRDGWRTIDTLIVTGGPTRVASRFLADTPPDARIIAI